MTIQFTHHEVFYFFVQEENFNYSVFIADINL